MVSRDKAHKQRDRASQSKAATYSSNETEDAAALQENNIETQFQNQIQSQLQNQLQNELSQTFEHHEEAEGQHNANVNILDSTNIDDELRNLEQLDINNIAKSAVAAAAVSFAQAATAEDIDHEIVNVETHSADDTDEQGKLGENEGNGGSSGDADEPKKDTDENRGTSSTVVTDPGTNLKGQSSTDFSLLLKGLVFCLPVVSDENEDIKAMVTSLGGEVVDDANLDALSLIPSKEDAKNDIPYQYLYQYVRDTYSKKSPLDINKYRVGKPNGQILKINIGEFPIKSSQDEELNDNTEETQIGRAHV